MSLLAVYLLPAKLKAQDGGKLFEQYCKACHHPTKTIIGPPLEQVRTKWQSECETEDLIYLWVNDFQKAAELDVYAAELIGLSPDNMQKFNLSREEIDAIFDYADNPPIVKDDQPGKAEIIIAPPNYNRNLNVMVVLWIVGIVLIFYIYTTSYTIKMYTSSDVFKNKFKKTGKIKAILALVALSTVPHYSGAVPNEIPKETFFEFTNMQVWIMVGVDLLLLGIAMYMKNLLYDFFRMNGEEPVKVLFFRKRQRRAFREIFNNAAPITSESDILMDHEYDGIRELDNKLPPWWLYMFYITIVFSVIYLFHYHILRTGDLQIESYQKEMVHAEMEAQAYREKMALNVDEHSVTMLNEESSIAEGKALFINKCQVCHGDKGQGGTGANLTDNYWIYGNTINDVFRTIKNGGNNGMQSWEKDFNPVEIQKISSFIMTLTEEVTPDMGGKFPEGEFYERVMLNESDTSVIEETGSIDADTIQISLPETE